MAGKLLNMSKVKQIIRLKENGVALQTISKRPGISRNTVKKYLRLIEAKNYPIQELLAKENEELEALLSNPDQTSQAPCFVRDVNAQNW
jgi:lambda repressor-like predicted transcriptional regulator